MTDFWGFFWERVRLLLIGPLAAFVPALAMGLQLFSTAIGNPQFSGRGSRRASSDSRPDI
jgi:hypothetical protein